MQIKDTRIGIIQDRPSYNELAEMYFANAALLEIANTFSTGITLIDDLARGTKLLHILAFDENLDLNRHDGSDGYALYTHFLELGLEGRLAVVSISNRPHLPITRIGDDAKRLVDFVLAL